MHLYVYANNFYNNVSTQIKIVYVRMIQLYNRIADICCIFIMNTNLILCNYSYMYNTHPCYIILAAEEDGKPGGAILLKRKYFTDKS